MRINYEILEEGGVFGYSLIKIRGIKFKIDFQPLLGYVNPRAHVYELAPNDFKKINIGDEELKDLCQDLWIKTSKNSLVK